MKSTIKDTVNDLQNTAQIVSGPDSPFSGTDGTYQAVRIPLKNSLGETFKKVEVFGDVLATISKGIKRMQATRTGDQRNSDPWADYDIDLETGLSLGKGVATRVIDNWGTNNQTTYTAIQQEGIKRVGDIPWFATWLDQAGEEHQGTNIWTDRSLSALPTMSTGYSNTLSLSAEYIPSEEEDEDQICYFLYLRVSKLSTSGTRMYTAGTGVYPTVTYGAFMYM